MISKLKRLKQVLPLIQEKKQTKRIKEMKYITVLDYANGRVYQYDMKHSDYYSHKDAEKFLVEETPHRLGNIEWMIHENPQVITN
jgi:hypothetical protein